MRRWFKSKNFWLHLAAIAALTVLVAPIVYHIGNYDTDYYGWNSYLVADVFAGLEHQYGKRVGLLDASYATHYWFVGFCLLMNAIRKNPSE